MKPLDYVPAAEFWASEPQVIGETKMGELPFFARLVVAICPKVEINVAPGVVKKISLSKVFNIGRDKITRTYRRQLKGQAKAG